MHNLLFKKYNDSKRHFGMQNYRFIRFKSIPNRIRTNSATRQPENKAAYLPVLVSDFVSVSSSFIPSLKLLTPFPIPFISSGIFLPPKSKSTIARIRSISVGPILLIVCLFFLVKSAKLNQLENINYLFNIKVLKKLKFIF